MSATPDFDRVARVYRWAEYLALGPLLEQTRNYWLHRLSDARKALLLGDGDGRFLAQLFAQNPNLTAVAIDSSAAMIGLLAQRSAAFGARLRTRHMNALDVRVEPGTDLIVSHFFLDCLTQSQLEQLARTMAADTAAGTQWLVSDFAIPPGRVTGMLARAYVRALYFAFRVVTGLRVTQLPDITQALKRAGFEQIARHEKIFGLLYSELWRRK